MTPPPVPAVCVPPAPAAPVVPAEPPLPPPEVPAWPAPPSWSSMVTIGRLAAHADQVTAAANTVTDILALNMDGLRGAVGVTPTLCGRGARIDHRGASE